MSVGAWRRLKHSASWLPASITLLQFESRFIRKHNDAVGGRQIKPIPTEIHFRVSRINEGGRRKLPFEKAALKVWFNESLIQTCKIRVIIDYAYLP